MSHPVRTLVTALAFAAVSSTPAIAATMTSYFTNAERIDTLYLWTDEAPGTDTFDLRDIVTSRSMVDWTVAIDTDQNRAVLYGNAVDARTGLIEISSWYARGATPTLQFASALWLSDTDYTLQTSGVYEFDRGSWRASGTAFSRGGDIVNPRAPTSVVPVPTAALLMLSALTFLAFKTGGRRATGTIA